VSAEHNLDTLNRVFDGVDMTPQERHTLEWIATWERESVENLARLVLKARRVSQGYVFADFERMGREMMAAGEPQEEGDGT
jgi:hypothetical protein